MGREVASSMRRRLRLALRRLAACLALAAAFAFVLDGALALDRHFGEGGNTFHGAHVHVHLPMHGTVHAHAHSLRDSSHHHAAGSAENDVAEHDHGSTPTQHADGASCCYAACCIGAMLLCPGLKAEALPLSTHPAKTPANAGSGIEPEGPRKPPRPSALA